MEILTIVQEQISLHGDTAALNFKTLCGDLEECLQGVLSAVKELKRQPKGLQGRFKEIIHSKKTAEDIIGYGRKIRELRSNFVLTATMDTNFQVHKVLTVISPVEPPPPMERGVNTCPSPSRIFHGRKNILERMHSYFSETVGQQHIFLLHGLGGAGKTQIGLKFVQNTSSLFSDMFLIDASTMETIATGLKNIAIQKKAGDSWQQALRWLGNERDEWLLFFDNADDPQINLNQYFPKCNHGNILITSRNPGLCVYAGVHFLVSDLEETEAAELLLKSAAQEMTPDNKAISTQIVKALWYFPLAIIQAGAFIAKSGLLSSYLASYTTNWAQLLSEKPAQSHDEYAWTVYTTWQMSFEKLSPAAATLLQLCSLLHHQGISEQIFSKASKYRATPGCPSEEELQQAHKVLSHYLGPAGGWEPLNFMDVTNELRAYSLITFDLETNAFSIHPLWEWAFRQWNGGERGTAALWLVPHIESLLQSQSDAAPDFNLAYGEVYTYSGRFKKAEQLQVLALMRRKKILGENHPETLKVMGQLAKTYKSLGQFRRAEELKTVVLDRQKSVLGINHPETLQTMEDLSGTYLELAQFQEAERLTVIALEKRKEILGEDHPDTLTSTINLGWILHSLGRLNEAEEIQTAAIEKMKRLLGDEHPLTIWTKGNLGSTYRDLGQLEQAEKLQVSVVEQQRKILGEDHPYRMWTMGNLALTYQKQGKLKLAQEIQVVVLEKQKRTLGEEHPETVRAKEELDSTLAQLQESNF
ncbi:P-loop containing nucleoside triphosphate hydrolase protein [Mycena olivaceomarginata]|nr:P-loop containing nucleoside triphosphate hydrolase protein [Mycena olivaceomarginata]